VSSKEAAAKVVPRRDKWALKKWFVVHAPPYFDMAILGEVPSSEPEKLIGRTIEASLFDITKDLSHLHVKLKFQINRVEGSRAFTRFKQLELSRDYVRSLVRRGTSKVVAHVDVSTKDNWRLRITAMVITAYRAKTSQKRAIRKVASELIAKYAGENDIGSLIRDIAFGKLAEELQARVRKIFPTKKSEIAKVKVLKHPEEVVEVRPEVVQEVPVHRAAEGQEA